MKTSRDFGLLRGIAGFLRVMGWIGLVLGVIAAIVLFFIGLPPFLRWTGIFLAVVGAVAWFVPMYGLGSVLHLLLDIERNTEMAVSQSPPK
jgi:hypothetical protein